MTLPLAPLLPLGAEGLWPQPRCLHLRTFKRLQGVCMHPLALRAAPGLPVCCDVLAVNVPSGVTSRLCGRAQEKCDPRHARRSWYCGREGPGGDTRTPRPRRLSSRRAGGETDHPRAADARIKADKSHISHSLRGPDDGSTTVMWPSPCSNERIFCDIASRACTARPGLDTCLQVLAPGDTLVVWRLDRLGRSMAHL